LTEHSLNVYAYNICEHDELSVVVKQDSKLKVKSKAIPVTDLGGL
jgi:hypothetical protein